MAEAARELLAAGLSASYTDGDMQHDFTTGGTRAGTVVLNGRWWLRVNPDAVALRALYGAARAWSGEYHGLGGELHYDPRVRRLENQSADVMAGAPLPAAFVPPGPAWRDDLAHNIEGAPVIMSDSTRDQLERDRATEEKRDRLRGERAKRDYVEYRATAVAEHGEQHVRDLKHRLFIGGRPFGMDPAKLVAEVAR